MKRRLGVTLLGGYAVWAFGAEAQPVVRGSIRDKTSHRVLPGALISTDQVGSRVIRAGADGGFSIPNLPAGLTTIRVRAIGFQALETKAELSGRDTVEIEFQLDRAPTVLDPVTVSAGQPSSKANLNRITLAEVDAVVGSASDGYDVVRLLRPHYLRGRGYSRIGNPSVPEDTTAGNEITRAQRTAAARAPRRLLPKVTIDDGPLGDLESLRQVSAATIKEIRFISPLEATTLYGGLGGGGVIVVVLKLNRP